MEILYNRYSDYLKKTYGEKVYKLPINLPISCPNREQGESGCAFCAEDGTGFEALNCNESVTVQLTKNRGIIEKKYHAHKFIAYFQNYTNTWLPVSKFCSYLWEASEFPQVVEIAISTRPDCIKKEYLDILEQIHREKNIQITIELGLQTVNYHTLARLNRGHGLGSFLASVLMIQKYGFLVCTHLILNLPYDTMEDVKELASVISALPVKIVKLHSLYISRQSKLGLDYQKGNVTICSSEEYLDRLTYFVEHIRSDIVLERLFSRIPEKDSLFSNWGRSWRALMEDWIALMAERNSYQGKYYVPPNESAYINVSRRGW